MRPEAALVIALAAGHRKDVRSALRGEPDSEQVANLAAVHQVGALCWWMWNKVIVPGGEPGSLSLPPALSDRLRMSYVAHLLRNQALVKDYTVLQDALIARGIETLYFKGPWMAFSAYPNSGTRPVGDVDLGVREEQYGEAVAALRAAGWRSNEPLPQNSSEALLQSHYRRQLRFAAWARRPVELHFRLVNMGPPEPEERWVWESARDLQVGPCTLRVPGPEAMLLHLLLHANQHGFAFLRLLHDIRWALERDHQELDVARLLFYIRNLRCRASCYHALQLAVELAGATVQDSMARALRPSRPRRALFAKLWNLRAVRGLEAARRYGPEAEAPLFYLMEMGSIRQKAKFAARVIDEAGGPRALLEEARRIFPEFAFLRRKGER